MTKSIKIEKSAYQELKHTPIGGKHGGSKGSLSSTSKVPAKVSPDHKVDVTKMKTSGYPK